MKSFQWLLLIVVAVRSGPGANDCTPSPNHQCSDPAALCVVHGCGGSGHQCVCPGDQPCAHCRGESCNNQCLSTTIAPTKNPTKYPTLSPTEDPTLSPTEDPTLSPTEDPTLSPTQDPTLSPTKYPTLNPTLSPIEDPTLSPTANPTGDPTLSPTMDQTSEPTSEPTTEPTDECDSATEVPLSLIAPWSVDPGAQTKYLTNCVVVALVGTANWTDTADLMATKSSPRAPARNQLSQIDDTATSTLNAPYFDQVFSVTNDNGNDCVIQVSAGGSITLLSWSLPIISYHAPDGDMYYVDQNNIDNVTNNDPNNKVVIRNNNQSPEAIDWNKLAVVTMDGIVYASQQSKFIDETTETTVNDVNSANINENQPKTVYIPVGNDYESIKLPFGIFCLFIVGVVGLSIIVLCGWIGMKCTESIWVGFVGMGCKSFVATVDHNDNDTETEY